MNPTDTGALSNHGALVAKQPDSAATTTSSGEEIFAALAAVKSAAGEATPVSEESELEVDTSEECGAFSLVSTSSL